MHPVPLENLAGMEGFSEVFGVAMNDDGSIDPLSQLFRANFVGVETGPMMSQVKRASARIVLCLFARIRAWCMTSPSALHFPRVGLLERKL